MALRTFAFRIGQEADLLDEDEWREIEPLLVDRIKWVKGYRAENGCSIEEATRHEPIGQAALDKYRDLTGTKLGHPDQLWGVRQRDYGSLCPKCSRPFRTPRASMCAECGFQLPDGLKAGRLGERSN